MCYSPSPDPEGGMCDHTPLEIYRPMRRESKEEAASTKPRKKKQLNIHIIDYKIPWSLENPTKLHSYMEMEILMSTSSM